MVEAVRSQEWCKRSWGGGEKASERLIESRGEVDDSDVMQWCGCGEEVHRVGWWLGGKDGGYVRGAVVVYMVGSG